jgi:soluble lytic murein transglycosylase-like protein
VQVLALAVAAAGASASWASTQPLWGYVDGRGVAHVANRQIDSRFSLVLGGPEQQDNALRVSGKTDGAAKLLTWLEIAPEVKAVQHLLRDAARRTGVDAELLKAVIAVESGFNARAVSPRGAVGLMQLTPETADRYATPSEVKVPVAQRLLDARTNILTGARMLADLTRRYGSIDVALAAWNAGEGTVRKYGNAMPPIEETQAHVQMVLELYWGLLQRSLPTQARQVRVETASSER